MFMWCARLPPVFACVVVLRMPVPSVAARSFANPRYHRDRSWLEVLKWKFTSRAQPWPKTVPITPQPVAPAPTTGFRVTWVNHATFLIQTPQLTLLTDPQWSESAGPFGRLGPRRVHAPGVNFDALPRIDAVLLSHDHYDHCDLPTLRRLTKRFPQTRLLAPLGHAGLARRAGFRAEAIRELAWWQEDATLAGLAIVATPARHWSNRLSGARNSRLWAGFHLRDAAGRAIYFSGDTAYDDEMFRDIRTRLGAPALAMLPIGAYEPRWFMVEQHCNPAEAVRIHVELGAGRSIGMHWGTFQLTDESREAPLNALAEALVAHGVAAENFITLGPGTSVAV